MKKAAQSLGVGLELARTDEALAYTEGAYETPAEPSPEAKLYATLKGHIDSMSAQAKTELKTWWSSAYPDQGAPSTTSSLESLNAAIVEAVKISTPGVTSVDSSTGEVLNG